MYTFLTLKMEQARANCAILMLLSLLVCSSEREESGIATQKFGIYSFTSSSTAFCKKPSEPKNVDRKMPFLSTRMLDGVPRRAYSSKVLAEYSFVVR